MDSIKRAMRLGHYETITEAIRRAMLDHVTKLELETSDAVRS